jgi:hypothetical protein
MISVDRRNEVTMSLMRKMLSLLASGAIAVGGALAFSPSARAQQEPVNIEPSIDQSAPTKSARSTKPKHRQVGQGEQSKRAAQAESKEAEPTPQPAEPAQNAAAPPPAVPPPGPTPSIFDEHARQGKIVTCANVFGALGRGVAGASVFTAQTQWDSKAGDAHAVESLVALNGDPNNPAQNAAGVVFAAPNGHSCEGTLVRVTPAKDNCATMAAALAKVNGRTGALGDLTVMALPNGAQVMLVPFGEACVAVTTLRASS